MYTKITTTLLFLVVFSLQLAAQSITGFVYNSANEPIPYANIFVKEMQSGTSSDDNGKYYLALPARGEYNLVISALGYETQTFLIVGEDGEIIRDIQLEDSSVELDEIVVKASKRDPAYAIIQNVIDNKKAYLASTESYKTEVYVKATEDIIQEEKKKKKKPEVQPEEEKSKLDEDPFEEQKRKHEEILGKLNMIEMQVTVNYQYPKQYKEERTAYKAYGSKHGLFVPRFEETDFNFYRNMVSLTGIAELPVISPISRTSILSYKYKLEESKEENGVLVHKIKVIPRKTGNATVSGYLYINDGIWNINRLDLKLYKSGLKFFDGFQLKQRYEQITDSLWIPTRQEFIYETKQGRFKTFKGNTTMLYSDYQHNYEFPAKFFGSEVAVTTREAYKRDSLYWNDLRPEPLTADQQKVVSLRDSIEAYHNSKEYKDSVQAEFNKVTFLEIIWDGVAFQNHEKKQSIWFGPIASFWDFSVIGGFRLGAHGGYFRRWENGRFLSAYSHPTIGIQAKDIQGTISGRYRYAPHRLGDIEVYAGRDFTQINPFAALSDQGNPANYILRDILNVYHRIEVFNGFYVGASASWADRQSIAGYKTYPQVNDFFNRIFSLAPEEIVDQVPLEFEDYQALITEVRVSYTPGQRFMTEPNRKIVLNSPYPTFSLTHRKGWDGLFSSDINFDYLEAEINQKLILGPIGNSNYTVKAGKFVNTKDVKFIDLKRIRRSDRYLFIEPLETFQALDTIINTTDLFLEAHYIHHFNGALINNIPLLKKTRIRTVAGGSFLWLPDNNIRHEELFAGIERVFKLGARRRLRLGVYGVVGNSNISDAAFSYKFSIDVIDTWKKDWSF